MSKTIVLKKGLDVPVSGAAELKVSSTRTPDIIALQPSDFKGLIPRLLVKEGDSVLCGSPVLSDKIHPEILVVSPVSGTVKEIVRGEKRKLLAVVIENDHKDASVKVEVGRIDLMDAAQLKTKLLEGGLWPWIIQRPYGIVANPEAKPKAIFISTFDSAPLAADSDFVLGADFAAIQAAINALGKLTDGGVHVGLNEDTIARSAFHKLENCTLHSFKGKHPAGNVGVQISHVCPIRKEETVWTVSLLGLAVIGKYLQSGKIDYRRKVAVCGPMAIEPSYILTLSGMPMKDVTSHVGTNSDQTRFISGNVLSGTNAGAEGYLGFYDNQITLIKEGTERELFGWMRPIRYKQFSTDHCYFSWLTPWRKYDMDTNVHGGPRAFVMSDAYYAKVLPMDIYPLYLTKACLAGDIDKMEKFGIYEVLPEDLALCEFVDPSKNDIQSIIADGISLMLKEMA